MGMENWLPDWRVIVIRVKIERAKKHLKMLENDLLTYGDQHFHAITKDSDPETGEIVVSAPKKRRKLPFDALAAAGDVIQNLRSALDYLAQQLVWAGSGREPSRQVEFPIGRDAEAYQRDKPRRVRGMRPEAIEFIDSLKPYKGGNDKLWQLHELNNIDKHRLLITYAADCFLTADWLDAAFPFNLKASDPNFVGVFDSDVEKDVEREIDEVIRNSGIASGHAMLPTLHGLVAYVDSLIESFKPFLSPATEND